LKILQFPIPNQVILKFGKAFPVKPEGGRGFRDSFEIFGIAKGIIETVKDEIVI